MIRHCVRAAAAALVLAGVAAPAGAQGPLTASEVLLSVEQALPLLERARRELDAARGAQVSANGAFDLTLKAESLSVRGYYDNDRVTSVLEQPLAPLGLTTFGGYRSGRGVFAPYDGKAQTLSEGELRAGFTLPLLRDRSTDARRTGREVADRGVDAAERGLDKARLTYFKDALAAYWNWAAAGRQRDIVRALLDLALARDGQLADGVGLGQTAPVERTDNRRAILQRRSALATAERSLQQAAIELSLYLRGPDGAPLQPSAGRLRHPASGSRAAARRSVRHRGGPCEATRAGPPASHARSRTRSCSSRATACCRR
ncbi:MAG: TolC family protein [Vicinamibacterales bacterium]